MCAASRKEYQEIRNLFNHANTRAEINNTISNSFIAYVWFASIPPHLYFYTLLGSTFLLPLGVYILSEWHRFPAGMDASQMHLWDVLHSVSETSQRGLICKSLRRLPGDWLIKNVSSETSLRSLKFSQRRLWVASGTVILGLQTKALFF